MKIDSHVHICAFTPEHGRTSAHTLNSIPFRYMRWRLGIPGSDATTEQKLVQRLADTINQTEQLDAAVVLAFDGVWTRDGQFDDRNTHLHVTNEFVIGLCQRYPKMLFGASVHPYRKDAVAEIERCVKAGAVLLKWLPIVQDFDPSDPLCFPLYEALAHYKLPLLSHTGGEKSLPVRNLAVADPKLLVPALERGVTVIAAHCGTRSALREVDFVPDFVRMAEQYENLFGDTAALNLPTRSYAWPTILKNPTIRKKLVHGSDWPIPPFP
ncbi:MAG TPA: amidohydrolase family protein, partial [Humisphaera sp.]|nr:amidohydrolase family protein [Humisphaera sp.]